MNKILAIITGKRKQPVRTRIMRVIPDQPIPTGPYVCQEVRAVSADKETARQQLGERVKAHPRG